MAKTCYTHHGSYISFTLKPGLLIHSTGPKKTKLPKQLGIEETKNQKYNCTGEICAFQAIPLFTSLLLSIWAVREQGDEPELREHSEEVVGICHWLDIRMWLQFQTRKLTERKKKSPCLIKIVLESWKQVHR